MIEIQLFLGASIAYFVWINILGLLKFSGVDIKLEPNAILSILTFYGVWLLLVFIFFYFIQFMTWVGSLLV